MAPRCPPSDHIPRQICQAHELLRAQLTHPEPPDVDDDVPSFPARSACTGVLTVADALAFEHKYTSGVIAWAPDDTPTDAQIGAVVDAFERTAWAGLDLDRYAWAAVVYRERDGGVRVHVVAALQEAGLGVPRQGKDYLTALDPTTGDRWRLKGELYAHDFQGERLDRAVAQTAGDRTRGPASRPAEALQHLLASLRMGDHRCRFLPVTLPTVGLYTLRVTLSSSICTRPRSDSLTIARRNRSFTSPPTRSNPKSLAVARTNSSVGALR